ncbi:MAG TPA: TlpA disulfide reductase family protein [Candidatus Kapabacteria bacterium]|nr:TlpA disulfide reductase family protein [Candidatus Kapabacteria bacterium]
MKNHTKAIAFLGATIVMILSMHHPCSAQQPEAKSILLGAATALERHQSVEYTATMKQQKSVTPADTFTCTGKVDLIRDTNDRALGGKYLYTTVGDNTSQDNFIWLYDQHFQYTFDKHTKTAKTVDPRHREHGVVLDIRNTLLWRNFLFPKRIRAMLYDTLTLIGDTNTDNIPCYEIKIQLPLQDSDTNASRETMWLYISKKDSIPVIQQWLFYQHRINYYSELHILNYKFDAVPDIGLTPEMQSSYTFTPFDPNPNLYKTLDSGAVAPPLTGKVYQQALKVASVDYHDKVTLLDFWYQDCHWCVESFPQIEKIHEKFKGTSFQVIGVNSYDNNEDGIKRLPRFLHYNPVSYNTMLVDTTTPNSFSVNGWPVIYLVDKNGRIAFAQVGYSDDLYAKLEKKISELLK